MVSIISLVVQTAWAFQAAPPPKEVTPLKEVTPEIRGDVMMAYKRYRDALDFYKPGAATSASLANKAGIAYQQLLDLDNARRYYEKAIKLRPTYPEAINNLGTVYFARKSYRRAIEQYKKALRINPDSSSILSNLGTAYFARKNYDEAAKAYQEAVALDPEVFENHSNQGTLVQDQTVEERAKYHYYLAKTFAKAGTRDRALQYIRKALEEGFKERERFVKDPEFAMFQDDREFLQIMALEPKVL
jgi:tetratricopeptide (TPR) repeat protein